MNRTVFPSNETLIEQTLFAREEQVYMQHPPICSVTFFEGNLEKAKLFLETRMTLVLNLNPWLGGKISRVNKKLRLIYPRTDSVSLRDVFFAQSEPIEHVHPSTEYETLMKACIPLSIGGDGLAMVSNKKRPRVSFAD